MKRKRSIGLSVGICLLLLGLFSNISVFAAVTEGKAGETLTGEYAVIVNTDPEVAHNTGTLVFDDGADGTAPYTAGSVGASNSLGSVNVAGGSTNSAIALQSATTYTIGQEIYGHHIFPKDLCLHWDRGALLHLDGKKHEIRL